MLNWSSNQTDKTTHHTTLFIKLDPWQQKVLDTKGNKVICSGRQTGKSTIIAIDTAEFMLNNPKTTTLIVSITEDQAELMVIKILDYLEKEHPHMIAKGKKKPLKHQVTLKNGSTVRCRPVGNTGNAIRGFTGDRLVADEAAFMPEDIWAAAKPTLLTTAGDLILVSTPHGKQGYFYECFMNRNKRFTVFHINTEEVIAQRPISDSWTLHQRHHAIQFLEDEKKDMSELQYGQEYLGLFLEELRQFFPDALIRKCCIAKRPDKPLVDADLYMGCDIARLGGDESTFEIIQRIHKRSYCHVQSVVKKGLYTTDTETEIKELNKIWNLKQIGIDAGSGTLGVSIMDHLIKDSEVSSKMVAMNNRSISLDKHGKLRQKIFKEDMYDNLLAMMQAGEIELLDDDELILSLKSVQWELMRNDNARSKVRMFGNYTHIAEGLIRAAWLARTGKDLNFRIHWV